MNIRPDDKFLELVKSLAHDAEGANREWHCRYHVCGSRSNREFYDRELKNKIYSLLRMIEKKES